MALQHACKMQKGLKRGDSMGGCNACKQEEEQNRGGSMGGCTESSIKRLQCYKETATLTGCIMQGACKRSKRGASIRGCTI